MRVLLEYFGSRSFSNFAVKKSLEGNRLSPWEFSQWESTLNAAGSCFYCHLTEVRFFM